MRWSWCGLRRSPSVARAAEVVRTWRRRVGLTAPEPTQRSRLCAERCRRTDRLICTSTRYYRAMRLRDAALKIPQLRRLIDQRNALLVERGNLAGSLAAAQDQLRALQVTSPFMHYAATFDPQEVIRRHAAADVQSMPGYLTNFLGV